MNRSTFYKLYEVMKKKSPVYASLWIKSRNEFGAVWEQEVSDNISKVFGDMYNLKWEEAVNGYSSFCIDAHKATMYFEKHGKYKSSSYEECFKNCYHSPEYMTLRYLPGQYLSHYIWPHHQKMLQNYVKKILPLIKLDILKFFEVGVGCGMYSQKTLENLPKARGVGYDISDYSLEFTYRVVEAHGFSDRYNIRNQNILENDIEDQADLIVCQEVLEHLEDPQKFIKALYRAVRPEGWGYITAAINAAHTDHIYLYRSENEVRTQIEAAGWKIIDVQIEENYPEKPKELRPTIAGFLAKK